MAATILDLKFCSSVRQFVSAVVTDLDDEMMDLMGLTRSKFPVCYRGMQRSSVIVGKLIFPGCFGFCNARTNSMKCLTYRSCVYLS